MHIRIPHFSSRSGSSSAGGSVLGPFIGALLLLGSCYLMWWNEGRAVQTAKALQEGERAVVSVESAAVDPANDGKLIHTSGEAWTQETLRDEVFGVQTMEAADLSTDARGGALRLRRTVEMYQWVESSSTSSSSSGTTYSYRTEWKEEVVNARSFHHSGYSNPTEMPFSTSVFSAERVSLGAFQLSGSLIEELDAWRPVALGALPKAEALGFAHVHSDTLYAGDNINDPEVGDIRVTFSQVPAGTVSVVARQDGSSFSTYVSENGRAVELLEHGTVSAATMFAHAHTHNAVITWLLRLFGWMLSLFGFLLMLSIVRVLTMWLPIVDGIVGVGVGMVSFIAASALSMTVVAVAWLVFHPLASGILLAVAAGVTALLVRKTRSESARKRQAATMVTA
jgi:hypothetical protein